MKSCKEAPYVRTQTDTPANTGVCRHLLLEEKSAATMEKYLRDIRAFACWLGDREICKELTAEWKAYLAEQGYAPASINAMLSALNSLLAYLDLNDCPGEIPENPAAAVPGCRPGADKIRLSEPAGRGLPSGPGAAGLAGGDHRGHRHPGSAKSAISQWKPCGRARPKSPSKAKSA